MICLLVQSFLAVVFSAITAGKSEEFEVQFLLFLGEITKWSQLMKI